MSQLKVVILDVTGAKQTPVELPDDVEMRKLIPALVTKMGLPTTQGGEPIKYALDHRRTGKQLRSEDTMASAGVQPDDELRLLPTITAGGIPGLDINSVKDFTLDDLRKSGQVALVMMVRRFEELEKENLVLRDKIEIEKRKSTDRLVSTLLLLVSQVVLSIGTNLFTANEEIAGVAVISAGILQALLAIYLTFRKEKPEHIRTHEQI